MADDENEIEIIYDSHKRDRVPSKYKGILSDEPEFNHSFSYSSEENGTSSLNDIDEEKILRNNDRRNTPEYKDYYEWEEQEKRKKEAKERQLRALKLLKESLLWNRKVNPVIEEEKSSEAESSQKRRKYFTPDKSEKPLWMRKTLEKDKTTSQPRERESPCSEDTPVQRRERDSTENKAKMPWNEKIRQLNVPYYQNTRNAYYNGYNGEPQMLLQKCRMCNHNRTGQEWTRNQRFSHKEWPGNRHSFKDFRRERSGKLGWVKEWSCNMEGRLNDTNYARRNRRGPEWTWNQRFPYKEWSGNNHSYKNCRKGRPEQLGWVRRRPPYGNRFNPRDKGNNLREKEEYNSFSRRYQN